VPPPPTANEIHHGLRGCDDGERFVVWIQPALIPPRIPKQLLAKIPAPAQASAQASTRDAIRQPEPPPELRLARPAHHHKT
jgi:hypothetical protein